MQTEAFKSEVELQNEAAKVVGFCVRCLLNGKNTVDCEVCNLIVSFLLNSSSV